MRVVVVGAGKVGKHVATALAADGHSVLVLDNDKEVVVRTQQSREDTAVEFRIADACEVTALEAAGLAQADVVAAVTGDDEDNLVISLLAKQEFGVPRVVARVNHPKNEWLFNEAWGVDVALSTPHLLTAMVEGTVSLGSLAKLLDVDHGGARIEQLRLPATSPAVGRAVAELALPRESILCAVVRAGVVLVPHGDTLLDDGDEVVVLLKPEAGDELRRALLGADQSSSR